MDKNTKLLKVECDNFNLKGQLIIRIYDLDSRFINSFLLKNDYKSDFDNSQQLFFNMSLISIILK